MNRFRTVLPLVVIASILIFTIQAQSRRSLDVATLNLKSKGLLPNTAFTVFLAADCLGEIETNADGRGSMRFDALVENDSLRQNLTSSILRFNGPAADDVCFTPVHGKVEDIALFRKHPSATTTWITGARSINNDSSILHTIDWRSIPCVSTF